MGARVSIQVDDFDLSAEVDALRAQDLRVGAVCSFIGTVRDRHMNLERGSPVHPGEVSSLELEHYPGMTEKALQSIVDAARARWQLDDVLVIHRVGPLAPLDQIVLVAVTSAHRGEALAACEFVIDWLKTDAPFWKKESTPQGERWVDARESDTAAAARWGGR